jgi:hypothetical protein
MPIFLIAKKAASEIKRADPNKSKKALKSASLGMIMAFLKLRGAKTAEMIRRRKKL